MNDIVLHHYAGSPFSEKVRLVFGFKGLAWHSVEVPVMLPKPDVVALTGGYRRTPFMQIGADVYCDTALICRIVDALSPEPALYPAASTGLADILAQWADSALFWTVVPYAMQPAGAAHIFRGATAEFMKAFSADRVAMSPHSRRNTISDGAAQAHAHFARLDAMLADGRAFLLGAAPCIADFSVAQSVWFLRRAPPLAVMLAAFARLESWYERMHRFGQGRPVPLTSDDAIATAAAARSHAPVRVEAGQGFAAGDEVSVTPSDYALDPVVGELVGLTGDSVTVARTDPRAGTVHVHFPRLGFQVLPHPSTKATTP